MSEEIKIKRIDQLPASVRKELAEKDIIDGLVEFKIKQNSPKEVVSTSQALKLPSQLLEEFQSRC